MAENKAESSANTTEVADDEPPTTNQLVAFINEERPDVRAKAVEAILGLTGNEESRMELNAAEAPKALCSLVRGDENSKDAISALVNLSADSDRVALDQMLSCGILDDITEILFSPAKEEVEYQNLALMLLSNLTVSKEGANDVVQNANEDVRELLILKLLHLSLQSAPESVEDPFEYATYVVANLTQLEQGRQLLMDKGSKASSAEAQRPVMRLLLQLDSSNVNRRRGAAASIRNCCLVPELRDQLTVEVSVLLLFPRCIGG
jgi:hypothetical protein